MPPTPTNFFANMFPVTQYPSDTIRWEIEYGSSGMTPFVAQVLLLLLLELMESERHLPKLLSTKKIYFDEEFLNNLREPGSWATFQNAERHLARGAQKLDWRIQRRREWMFAQMLIKGSLSYVQKGGTKFSVSYGMPTSHTMTLGATRKWTVGADRNPIEDIFDAKVILADDAGVQVEYAVCNSQLLKNTDA